MAGTERIVVTITDEEYCGDCYIDLRDQQERDETMFVRRRRFDGTCRCCGAMIEDGDFAGYISDTP